MPAVVRVLLVASLLATPATAGVYLADDPCPFPVGPDGVARELPYLPNFKSVLDDRVNAANPAMPLTADGTVTFRGKAKQRTEGRLPANAPPSAIAARAVWHLRLGETDNALALVEPRLRDRVPDFTLTLTAAAVHAARGEFADAAKWHTAALIDGEPPATLPGADAAQTKWLLAIENGPYRRWLRDAGRKRDPATEDVPPVFVAPDGAPIKFVNDRGEYEPGVLAAAERAKLPADAVAVVQQLLLWAPGDTRLLWLLAEVYAATGRLREAEQVFDQCTWGRGYTNRPALMAHRSVVQAAVAKLPAEAADAPVGGDPPAPPGPIAELTTERLVLFGGLFAAVAVGLLVLQVRSLFRRKR